MTYFGFKDWVEFRSTLGIREAEPACLLLVAELPGNAASPARTCLAVWREAPNRYRFMMENITRGPSFEPQVRACDAEEMLAHLMNWSMPERLAALGIDRSSQPGGQPTGSPLSALTQAMIALAEGLATELAAELSYVVTRTSGMYDSHHKAYVVAYPQLALAAAHAKAAACHEEAKDEDYDGDDVPTWSVEYILQRRSLPEHLVAYASGELAPPVRPSIELNPEQDSWKVTVPGRGVVDFSGYGAEQMAAMFFLSLPRAKASYAVRYQGGLHTEDFDILAETSETTRAWHCKLGAGPGCAKAWGNDAAGLAGAVFPAVALAQSRALAEREEEASCLNAMASAIQIEIDEAGVRPRAWINPRSLPC